MAGALLKAPHQSSTNLVTVHVRNSISFKCLILDRAPFGHQQKQQQPVELTCRVAFNKRAEVVGGEFKTVFLKSMIKAR